MAKLLILAKDEQAFNQCDDCSEETQEAQVVEDIAVLFDGVLLEDIRTIE